MHNAKNWGELVSDQLGNPEFLSFKNKRITVNHYGRNLFSSHGRFLMFTKDNETLLEEISYHLVGIDYYVYLNPTAEIAIIPNYMVVDTSCNLGFSDRNIEAVERFLNVVLHNPVKIVVEQLKEKPFTVEFLFEDARGKFSVKQYAPPYDIYESEFLKKTGLYQLPAWFVKTFMKDNITKKTIDIEAGELSSFIEN